MITRNIVDFNVRYLNSSFYWADEWNSMSTQNQLDIEKNAGRIPQAVEIQLTLKKK